LDHLRIRPPHLRLPQRKAQLVAKVKLASKTARVRCMRFFRYRWTIIARIDFTLVVLAVVAIIGFLVIANRGELVGGLLFILIGFLLFLPLYINARFSLSTIRVDEFTIGARVCNVEWRTIAWSSVKRIRKLSAYNIALKRESYTIAIDQSETSRYFLLKNGPISFSDFIDDFESLISFINHIITKHKIDVFVPERIGRKITYRPIGRL
jgi:hypothetical protein